MEVADIPYSIIYHLLNNGAVQVKASVNVQGKNLPELLHVGMRMTLPETDEQFTELESICFSALSYTAVDLNPGEPKQQYHPSVLNEQNFLPVHINFDQRGAGGDNSLVAYPNKEYQITNNTYTYSYINEPLIK